MLSVKAVLSAAILGGSINLVAAEDVLTSSRKLNKRFTDDNGNYNISFYHINDVHAHLDQFSSSGTDCTRPERGCYGGYARVKTVVDETRPSHNDSLLLNIGDEFQGTLFFSYYGGEKIAETLNEMGFDGMTLGNHEFDRGDDVLGDFLQNLTFPIISANIQSDNPKLNATIKPYHIYEEYQLAVIGVTTETTPGISSPGKGTVFSDAIEAVQNTVNLIRSTTNITRIAAITHIGYEQDQKLAESTTGLYIIMGGHSHTPLGDFEGAEGPYPTIKQNKDGDDVFIVTAYRWGEYLGYIDVTYDAEGKVLEYHGGPIHLTNTTEQDPELQAQINAWRGPFEEFAAEVVGTSNVVLDQSTCQQQECLLGDFIADAMLTYRLNSTSDADFALINAGGVRATIDEGPITRGEVLTSFPFGNAVIEIPMTGEFIWNTLEGIVSGINVDNADEVTSFVQVSRNIKIEYNPANTNGSKLVGVTIGNATLNRSVEYQVVTIDFLAGGGDNFFSPQPTDFVVLDTLDEVLVNYIGTESPVDIQLEGRIVEVNGTASTNGSDTTTTTGGGAAETSPSSAAALGFSELALFVALAIGFLNIA